MLVPVPQKESFRDKKKATILEPFIIWIIVWRSGSTLGTKLKVDLPSCLIYGEIDLWLSQALTDSCLL
jgi:hypothetical protein